MVGSVESQRQDRSESNQPDAVAVINGLLDSLTHIRVFFDIWPSRIEEIVRIVEGHHIAFNRSGDFVGLLRITSGTVHEDTSSQRFKVVSHEIWRRDCIFELSNGAYDSAYANGQGHYANLSDSDLNQLLIDEGVSLPRILSGNSDELDYSFHTLESNFDLINREVSELSAAIRSANNYLQSLPEECLDALNRLTQTDWRSHIRLHLLDLAGSWPGESSPNESLGAVPATAREFLRLLERSNPIEHWRRFVELADTYKRQLLAIRGEIPTVDEDQDFPTSKAESPVERCNPQFADSLDDKLNSSAATGEVNEQSTGNLIKKPKRSTSNGEAKTKIIGKLTAHHQYENGSCTHLEPMGVNQLAREIGVSSSTVSGFFKNQFGGYVKYTQSCQDSAELGISLKILNGELTPSVLYNSLGDDDANLADQ